MMTQNPPEIRALAFVINAIRPSWPTKLIEESLAKSGKPFDVLADDAIDAARNATLRNPGVLSSHRRPERPLGESSPLPPPVVRCEKCGRITDAHHTCPTGRPPWWTQAQQINAQYAASIRAARTVGDHKTAADLTAKQRTELAKVMA